MVGSNFTFRKSSRNQESLPGERSADTLGLLFLLLNHFSLLICTRTGYASDHVKYSSQEETEEEKAEKQFRLPVHEDEETQRNNDCNNRVVLSKGDNATYDF